MKKSLVFLICIFIVSCSKNKQGEVLSHENVIPSEGSYAVHLILDNSDSSQLEKIGMIEKTINGKFHISYDSTSIDKGLMIDGFSTSISAWSCGFTLKTDSLISSFQIIYNNKIIENEYDKFIFVSEYLNRPSLYSFDFNSKKNEMLWSKWGRKILGLYPDVHYSKYFFTTGLTLGYSGGFPLITDARLYTLNKKSSEVDRLNIFGNGLQLAGGWHNVDTFKTSFLMLDSLTSSEVIDQQMFFSLNGNVIDTLLEHHNILEDGVIGRADKPLEYSSKDDIFTISKGNLEKKNELVIVSEENKPFVLDTLNSPVNYIGWTDNSDYLILRVCLNNSNNCSLKIYDIMDKVLLKNININSRGDILVYGYFIIFNDTKNDIQYIRIFDLFQNDFFTEITNKTNSGIFNIPIKLKEQI